MCSASLIKLVTDTIGDKNRETKDRLKVKIFLWPADYNQIYILAHYKKRFDISNIKRLENKYNLFLYDLKF